LALHTVCSIDDLARGQMKAFKAGDERVVVYHLDEGFFATQASCTHMFGPLARGKLLDGCRVQCPLHHARFDIRSGKVVDWANFPPGIQALNFVRGEKALRIYKVSVKGDEVRVEI
jgi:3-phenylpropionate/trans-cinnamate dioxygenase ferredoxin subunit